MDFIFEIKDKTGRKIRLTKRQWEHIIARHPQISSEKEKIIETLENPDKMVDPAQPDSNKRFYYKHYKNRPSPNKFVRVIVKYLNGDGFVLTAQFMHQTK
ncbi:hypothetical protein HY448_00030 [Candidatus Pacearchaeota archaeon]|nr:hypothetical protein [Candidatus Pacearchaeota archaeon]